MASAENSWNSRERELEDGPAQSSVDEFLFNRKAVFFQRSRCDFTLSGKVRRRRESKSGEQKGVTELLAGTPNATDALLSVFYLL